MKEKKQKAAALSYDRTKDSAPRLKAKGDGRIAEKIIAKATENDVPVLQDASLVELLGNLDIDETIPGEVYEAVAEVFAFVYQLDRQMIEDE